MTETETVSGGFDYSFVDSPVDDELFCSICLLVQREPVLTSCCGNHFCCSCIQKVRAQNLPCPLCNAQKFSTMIDKYFARKVNELKIYCPQKGCDWNGTLGSLEKHLDFNRAKGGCKFLLVICPNQCGTKIAANEQDKHNKVCPRRMHVCKFCGYKGVYEDMSSKHWKVCEKYPLPCPNRCGEIEIERRNMSSHRQQDCPLELVECEFMYGGCETRLPRKDIPEHLTTKVQYHLSLVSRKCTQLIQQFPAELAQRLQEELRAKDAELHEIRMKLKERESDIDRLKFQFRSLEEELDDVKSDCLSLKSTVFIPPFEFVMTDFRKHKREDVQWLSPPFYSHVGGYCLCVSVDANGSDEGKGTHASLYVNIMKGEYDEHLRWPFRGSIKVRLCNQRQADGCLEELIIFGYDTTADVAGRVQRGEVAESGLGIPQFIEHSQLGFNPSKNTEFLKNNCLRLKVDSVVLAL